VLTHCYEYLRARELLSEEFHVPSPTLSKQDRLHKVPVIAVVDDDDSFRRAIESLIRSLGYTAAIFASGDAFLRSSRIREVDCLITDVQMPEMSGIELQNRLIAQGHLLPVIFVTAFPEIKIAQGLALAVGTVGILDKPFSDLKLIKYLNDALAARDA
jgi:FixJ family two-component response regulator